MKGMFNKMLSVVLLMSFASASAWQMPNMPKFSMPKVSFNYPNWAAKAGNGFAAGTFYAAKGLGETGKRFSGIAKKGSEAAVQVLSASKKAVVAGVVSSMLTMKKYSQTAWAQHPRLCIAGAIAGFYALLYLGVRHELYLEQEAERQNYLEEQSQRSGINTMGQRLNLNNNYIESWSNSCSNSRCDSPSDLGLDEFSLSRLVPTSPVEELRERNAEPETVSDTESEIFYDANESFS